MKKKSNGRWKGEIRRTMLEEGNARCRQTARSHQPKTCPGPWDIIGNCIAASSSSSFSTFLRLTRGEGAKCVALITQSEWGCTTTRKMSLSLKCWASLHCPALLPHLSSIHTHPSPPLVLPLYSHIHPQTPQPHSKDALHCRYCWCMNNV